MLPVEPPRCRWASSDPLLMAYHDAEWGVPCHDDQKLFEQLILEGAQAGLSWRTVLARRAAYHEAFCGLDPEKVAEFDAADIAAALEHPGIIHHRQKVAAAVVNARGFLAVKRDWTSFDRYLWSYVDGKPKRSTPGPTTPSPLALTLHRDLKRRGFRFMGPTICHSYLQAVGVLMDHEPTCFRYPELLPH